MNFPKPLKKGDNIFLLCPSSPIVPEEDIDRCIKAVKYLGYNPVLGKSLYENYGGYMAGSPEIRVNDIHRAFSEKDIKGIFCIKGGYSSSQLLDKIDYELIRQNPKIFVGYSDVTNLHIVFNQKCDLGTYHGPMVKSNMFDNFNEYTENSFFEAVQKESWDYKEPENSELSILNQEILNQKISQLNKENHKKLKTEISGTLIGGNLAIIVTTLGTEYEIDTKGKMLFLEDVDEQIGSLNRMLTHLKYSGKFDDCNGVILGNFADCNNRYITSDKKDYGVTELLTDFFKNYEKPVISGIESGHGKPFMATLPLGADCTVNIETKKISFKKN